MEICTSLTRTRTHTRMHAQPFYSSVDFVRDNPGETVPEESIDIGVNANLELVDKFCYLGDMLSVDGDADAAVENRIQIGCNKFR